MLFFDFFFKQQEKQYQLVITNSKFSHW